MSLAAFILWHPISYDLDATTTPATYFGHIFPEGGKVTLKSNSDERLSKESLYKSTGDEVLNDDFPWKVFNTE